MNEFPPPIRDQRKTDEDHLKLLWIFHFVCAGLSLLGIAFLILHFFIMSTVFNDPRVWSGHKGGVTPKDIFSIFIAAYIAGGILIVSYGVLNVLSAVGMRARKWLTFSFVVAGINCIQFPIGTVLGVFTIIVLSRDSVRQLYASPLR